MRSFFDTQPLSLDERPTVDEALKAFRAHILEYRKVLNDEGVWLFLSTVGCWGVTQPIFQLVAYGVTVMLFGARVRSRYTEKKSFPKIVEDLGERIVRETEYPEDRTRQLLLLEQLQKVYLSGLRPLRAGKVFAVCWLFYGASLGYTVLRLPRTLG